MDQRHEQVAHLGPVQRPVEQRILPVQHRPLESAFAKPAAGLPSLAERLRFHKEHSGPVMEKLHGWLESQFAERKTEPNSGLGKAITYLLRHRKALTTFLREAGAP